MKWVASCYHSDDSTFISPSVRGAIPPPLPCFSAQTFAFHAIKDPAQMRHLHADEALSRVNL